MLLNVLYHYHFLIFTTYTQICQGFTGGKLQHGSNNHQAEEVRSKPR